MDDKTCSQPVEAKAEGVVVVTWALDDPKDPFNWPRRKKYLNVLIPIYICLLTAANSTSTGIMSIWGPSRFHTTPLGFQLSVTAYLLPFACGSVLTAPLSELLGRKRIYQVATVLSALLFIPQALTTSLPVLLSMRAVQGAAASAGNALVGGSIADLFRARDRALPTNLFVLANLVGQGIAGLLGWVGGAGIAWCYGVQGIALALGAAGCFALSETRRDVLLSRRAEQLTRSTGVIHVTPDQSDQNESLKHKIRISCTRPIQFMFTEPIVAALSLWIGFNCLVASIALGLGVAPVLIYVYGPQLRARSKITSHLTNGAF
ncbi:hypothetical protein CspeluHIS016_0801500 [Cutaneotrichosporon spelunceum]|uniref:Major facilitator superfamily (MFS) profile domain-containing protein n=1 Tax=Cutaneotrichosporon spelunceum TaxID=1672016 RepID=A0AAD3YEZ1_9TREE|nr:hypothetical protein CspeluHIS016_0801500 [Cutaneotrichosporon spelunceum]